MKLAHSSSYNFTEKRLMQDSPRDFVSNFMDVGHTEAIMKCARELNMSVEDATAYALAFFNSLQDLFYCHHNIEFDGVSISTISDKLGSVTTVKEARTINALRGLLMEPYFTNRSKAITRAIKHLRGLCKKESKLTGERQRYKDPERYFAKKERVQKRKKILYNREYRAKNSRIKKYRAKKNAWMTMV